MSLGRTEFKFFSARSKVKVTVITNIKNTFSAVTLSIFEDIRHTDCCILKLDEIPYGYVPSVCDVTLDQMRQNRLLKTDIFAFSSNFAF